MITEKKYKWANNLIGLLAFAVAAVTYLLTIEPTASFWDCGEFILTGYKQEVGHPPGAPFFMLTSRFFSLFASDTTQVARMVNASSALFSALTILFLFWTITHLAKKMVAPERGAMSPAQLIGILGAGLVGSLAYTFTDSFWFSAVEGEVYGFSSLFTAVAFWAILKWEGVFDKPYADHWLIFICYLMGLSVGVHLLNLLTIPAIFLVYYFKKFQSTTKGTFIALFASFALLGIVMYGFIPGSVEMASWFELFFVNTLGFSFNSGVIVYLVATIGILIWAVLETYGENIGRMKAAFFLSVIILGIPFIGDGWFVPVVLIGALAVALFGLKKLAITPRLLNVATLSLSVFFIGYLSYATIVIRSSANPPMDQNSPNNIFSLKSYLNREQYGDRPLIYGQSYNAELKLDERPDGCYPVIKEGTTIWTKDILSEKDRYMENGKNTSYVYADEFNMLFPRMYSSSPSHVEAYKIWGEVEGTPVEYNRCGRPITVMKPTFTENMRYFFTYQLNFMYWRYFMWNFSGRQNDIQGNGEVQNGNWITGFNFLDNYLAGDQTLLPPDKAQNKGHNRYYLLPFLLGIAGLLYQLYGGRRGTQNFWLVGLLFFMTGIAIVLYLNQTPIQPRERDYAYTGSFYAFAIWIGFGVLALAKGLKQLKVSPVVAATAATVLALSVPAILAIENWDDHDRSGRYTMRDFGQNYLSTCAPNAIIFTNGDNDTFPLWYNLEVEGFRTDVRVCNLSYLQTDWYTDQMKRAAYESAPLPIELAPEKYIQGTRDVSPVRDMVKEPVDLRMALELFNDDSLKDDTGRNFMVQHKLYLPVDKGEVLANGVVSAKDSAKIVPRINIKLGNSLSKNEYMILQMLQDNHWKRPMYYAVTVGGEANLGLTNYLRLEGLASRVVPVEEEGGSVDTNLMYENLMHKFKWGGIDNPKVYLDENNRKMCATARYMFAQLIEGLIRENKPEKAIEATDFCLKTVPDFNIPHTYFSVIFADYYYQLGEKQKAEALLKIIADRSAANLRWFFSLRRTEQIQSAREEIGEHLYACQRIVKLTQTYNEQLSEHYMKEFLPYFKAFDLLN